MNAPHRARVLVVEDDPVARQLILSTLAHHDVVWTDSGLGLLECVLATGENTWDCDFDVIVSDVMLPDHNAFDILGLLRRKLVDTPLVVVSTNVNEVSHARAKAVAATAFLPKPVTPSILRAAVASALGEDQ